MARTSTGETTRSKQDRLKLEFVNGTMTLRALADKHGVSYTSIRQWASRYEWSKARNDISHAITKKAFASQVKTRIEELTQFNSDDLKMAKALRAGAASLMNKYSQEQKISLEDLSKIARIVADAQKIGRLALGASTDNAGIGDDEQGPILITDVPIKEYKEALEKALEEF